jgi:NACHT domain
MHKAGLASLAFFYFDFRDNNRNDLRSLLSSLLFQLCYQSASYSNIFSGLYAAHRCGSQYPSNAALTQCLKDMLNCPGQVPIYIIIDGVDECPKYSGKPYARDKVLELVKELVNLHLPNLHICVTSRPEIDIKDIIHPLTSHSVSLHDEK